MCMVYGVLFAIRTLQNEIQNILDSIGLDWILDWIHQTDRKTGTGKRETQEKTEDTERQKYQDRFTHDFISIDSRLFFQGGGEPQKYMYKTKCVMCRKHVHNIPIPIPIVNMYSRQQTIDNTHKDNTHKDSIKSTVQCSAEKKREENKAGGLQQKREKTETETEKETG